MIIVNSDGKKEEKHLGAPLTGRRLKSVTLTVDDINEIQRIPREKFVDWFYEILMTRFPPE